MTCPENVCASDASHSYAPHTHFVRIFMMLNVHTISWLPIDGLRARRCDDFALVHRNDNTFDNHSGNNISERSFGIGNRQRPSTTALMACIRASEMAFIRFPDLPGVAYSLVLLEPMPFAICLTLYRISANDRPRNMEIYMSKCAASNLRFVRTLSSPEYPTRKRKLIP